MSTEVLPEALAVAREIGDEYSRAKALTWLAPYLPEALLPEALAAARGIGDEEYRAWALTSLTPHLPEILPEALAAARGTGNEDKRATALTAFVKRLSSTSVEVSFWQETLHALGTLTRSHFLEIFPDLVPLILQLGGDDEVLKEVYQAIKEVSRWWR